MVKNNIESFNYSLPISGSEINAYLKHELMKNQYSPGLIISRLNQLIENMTDGLIITDRNDVITYVNNSICKMLAFTSEEVTGKKIIELIVNKNIYSYESDKENSGIYEPYETIIKTKDGKLKATINSPQRLTNENGEYIGRFIIITDITDIKAAEHKLITQKKELESVIADKTEQINSISKKLNAEIRKHKTDLKRLKESEIKYRQLFEHMQSCIAIYDAKKKGQTFILKDLNRSAEKTDKLNRNETIGKSFAHVFPDLKKTGLYNVIKKVWTSGRPLRHYHYYYKNKTICGWRDTYVYKLSSGEIVLIYDDITADKQTDFASEKRKKLSGHLPICSSCKKIRDDKGHWQLIEVYFKKHADVDFSHGICTECAKTLYPFAF